MATCLHPSRGAPDDLQTSPTHNAPRPPTAGVHCCRTIACQGNPAPAPSITRLCTEHHRSAPADHSGVACSCTSPPRPSTPPFKQANGTEEVIEELHKENTQLRTLLSDKERELQRARALALGADAAAAAAAMGQQQHGGTDSYSNGDTDLESNWHADDEEEGAAAHAAAANGGVPVPPAPPQSRPRRAWPLPSHESLVTLADGGTSDAGDSVASGASLGTKPAAAAHGAADEVLALNVSGVELHVLRSTLLLAPSSHLAAIFRQGSDCPPPHDTHGRPFL